MTQQKLCAILLPPSPPAWVDTLRCELEEAGCLVGLHNWRELDNLFEPERPDIVLLPQAGRCPAFLANQLRDYLAQGGSVVTMGGPPFNEEFYSIGNVETTLPELALKLAAGDFDKTPLFSFDHPERCPRFERDTTNPDSKKLNGEAEMTVVPGGVTGHCLRWHTENFYWTENFETPAHIPDGHNALGFYARGDENTCTITIRLIEEDGSIYKTRVSPTTDFTYFLLTKKEFIYAGNVHGDLFKGAGRGRPYPDFGKVTAVQFGHALSHAYSCAGEHTFWIDDLSSGSISPLNDERVSVDGLCPEYKFHPVTNAAVLRTFDGQAILPAQSFDVPQGLFAFPPRAEGTGVGKGRRSRLIPLLEAVDARGFRCGGYPAYLMLNHSYCPTRKPTCDGSAIAAFCINDDAFYQDGGTKLVVRTVRAILSPVLLIEGGSDEYTYTEWDRTAKVGGAVLVREGAREAEWRLRVECPAFTREYALSELSSLEEPGFRQIVEETAPFEGSVTVTLLHEGETADLLRHEVTRFRVPTEKRFAHVKPGTNEIFIGDEPVRFYGVNYMPSANIATEHHEEYEFYVSPCSYDPVAIETDLRRVHDIGFNAVSIFLDYARSTSTNNILHLIQLCEKYGIYANLSLRPHANPFDFNGDEVRFMIERFHLNEIDRIVGYDIAWERYVGTYEPCYGNFAGRKSFDPAWREFLLNRYGSFEEAERFFRCPLPRNERGEVIGLSDDQLRADGPHTALTAAYRRCIDTQVAKVHEEAVRFIKSVDPNHLVSGRSGDASTIPLVDPGIYGYDYRAQTSFDTVSPECYAISNDPLSTRQGIFTNLYARYANPDGIVQWFEFGKSIWHGSNFIENRKPLGFQADYYRCLIEMFLAGHSAGMFNWWFAGGYRIGEDSDFGILAPDGSDRPVTKVLREYAPRFKDAPRLAEPTYTISLDRDAHADGLQSLYRGMEDELFAALGRGETVALVDAGTGRTSADVELTETGNLPPAGHSPKYLDGFFLELHIALPDGTGLPLRNGEAVTLPAGAAAVLHLTCQNHESARWLAGGEFGGVRLLSRSDSELKFELPLEHELPYLGRAEWELPLPAGFSGAISAALEAEGRTAFGERLNVTVRRE